MVLSLFDRYENTHFPLSVSGSYDFINRRLLGEMKRITDYYHQRERAVNNSHLLVRMIKYFQPDIYESLFAYTSRVDSSKRPFYRHFEISSNVSYGKVRQGMTYVAAELYEDYFNLESIDTLSMLKPIFTVKVDYAMNHPIENWGKDIIAIDVMALLLGYREWALERDKNGMSTDPRIFVYQYVMPNMIPGYLTLSFLNSLLFENTDTKFKNDHPFYVSDLSPLVERYLKNIRRHTAGKKLWYEHTLRYLKVPIYGDALDYLSSGLGRINTMNLWVYWFVYGWWTTQLIIYSGRRSIHKNRRTMMELHRMIKWADLGGSIYRISWDKYQPIVKILKERLELFDKD